MDGGSKSSITDICKHHFLKHLPKITFFFLVMIMVACLQTQMGKRGLASSRGGMTPPPQYTSEELLATMKDRLSLTDEQQAKVRPIIEEYCQKRLDIIGKYIGQTPRGGDCCLRCDLQRLGESTGKQLATILTEKQLREYQKIQDELQPKPPESAEQGMGGKGPGGRGGMGGGRGGGGWGGRGGGTPPGM